MLKTVHYNLSIFETGDTYLSSLDKSRFTIIDNQLSFLSSQIGDGVISGWTIEASGPNKILIKDGMGVIDDFIVNTYGYYSFDLTDNTKYYFFVRRKPDINLEVGSFSDSFTLSYSDYIPPQTPQNVKIDSFSFESVSLTWDANVEPDFSYYSVWRSIDNINFTKIAETSENKYTDATVQVGATYYYGLLSYDSNGLTNTMFSTSVSATIPIDSRTPTDPLNVKLISGDSCFQLIWDSSLFLANTYEVSIYSINSEGKNEGYSETFEVDNTTNSLFINNLINGQYYRVVIKSVNLYGVKSSGVNVTGIPLFTSGTQQISSFLWDDEVLDSSGNVQINITLGLDLDSYLADPEFYVLTIEKDGEVSDSTIFLSNQFSINRYTVNGEERFIYENSNYIIYAQTSNSDGGLSSKFILRLRTTKYSKPGIITNLSILSTFNASSKSVELSWNNPTNEFAYNKLNIKRYEISSSSSSSSFYLQDITLKKEEKYILSQDIILNNNVYIFSITSYDSYGNFGETVSQSLVINEFLQPDFIPGEGFTETARPEAPGGVNTYSGNNQVTILWNRVESYDLKGYCVWRAVLDVERDIAIQASDFSKIVELDKSEIKYIDRDVINTFKYYYFVTSIDKSNVESLNPVDDEYYFYPLSYGEPRNNSTLTSIDEDSLNVAVSVNSAIISWTDSDLGLFDGYEIFKSIGTKNNFKKIGSTNFGTTTFTDTNGLNKNGSYYYIVRKFREEAEIVFSNISTYSFIGAINIGNVSVANNVITINNDIKYDLKLLRDPIIDEVKKQLLSPTHLYYSQEDDRRIRLSKNLEISNWTTEDYKTYSTVSDLNGTESSDYAVYINDEKTIINSYINVSEKTLIFEDNIIKTEDITEENPAPTVKVFFLNTDEIENTLPLKNIGDILSNKISKGKLNQNVIPKIDHIGRYREKCTPIRNKENRISEYSYEFSSSNSVSFFDIFIHSSQQIIAGTNEGIRVSKITDSTEWDLISNITKPCHKIYLSEYYGYYIALCINKSYISKESINTWEEISLSDSVKHIYDINEDLLGNIYISTDLGMFYTNFEESTDRSWKYINDIKKPCFAIFKYNGVLHVSSSDNIYYEDGLEWKVLNDTLINFPIFEKCEYSNYTFLTSNNMVLRKSALNSSYSVVSILNFRIRKINIFNDKIFITTDNGLLKSSDNFNIYADSNIEFNLAFNSINVNSFIPAVFAIRNIGNKMYLGLDEKIYSANKNNKISTVSDIPGVNPTFFIDGREMSVGCYYGKDSVYFDYPVEITSTVESINSYVDFNVENGGWAEIKYDAPVILSINSEDQDVIVDANGVFQDVIPNTAVSFILDSVKAIITPSFDARTSNFSEAFKYFSKIIVITDELETQSLIDPNQSVSSETISSLLENINLFYLNLNQELRSIVEYPSFVSTAETQTGFKYSVDVVSGLLKIENGVKKYVKVELTIKDVGISNIGDLSHREIDDKLELINSGLYASFANVQQSNIIKSAIEFNNNNPGEIKDRLLSHQSNIFSSCDDWYIKSKSSVDYTLINQYEIEKGNITDDFTILYPADIYFVSKNNEVWVCGLGGIIRINTLTFESSIVINNSSYFYNMSFNNDYIYSMADDGLYIINTNDYSFVKDIDIDLVDSPSGVIKENDIIYVSNNEGLFYKKDNDISWKLLFNINNAILKSSQRIKFASGQNPDNTSFVSEVYYSTGGIDWLRSTQFKDIIINEVTQRYDNVYYATDKGIIVEDFSGLFSGKKLEINALDLDEDESPDLIVINTVGSDDNSVFIGTSDGYIYEISGLAVLRKIKSQFNTIHKIRVINGKYWAFSDNLIQIEDKEELIKLTTGQSIK